MSDAMPATDEGATEHPAAPLSATAVLAAVAGVLLAVSVRLGAVGLLVAVAVVQALLVLAVAYGLRPPGRVGALVIATMAAIAGDVTVSVWPDSRLAPLLAVVGLAVPVMFVHQLMRGAGRVRVEESLGGIGLLVACVVAAAALVQVRHALGVDAAFAVVVVATAAVVVGCFTDLVVSVPRFDAQVPRGLVAVVVSAVVGAAAGQVALRHVSEYSGGRAAFAGGALGVLAALLAVAAAYLEHSAKPARSAAARRLRAVLTVLIPYVLLAPIALALCLAIRS